MELTVKTSTHTYPIYLERGCLSKISEKIDLNRKVMIITDENIPSTYIEIIKNQCKEAFVHICKSGEETKSFEVYEAILKEMLSLNFSRKDVVVALGGGVIGDLSGFVAATYMRGIDFVNVPTSTLSQIDSSIGGKVAINVDKWKNMVGAFYPPIAVFIDPNTLVSLPERHFYNGLVEALKAGLIYNKKIVDTMATCDLHEDIETILYESLLVKKAVVEEDEFEMGLRKILNFGHTIGHGLESYYDLKELLHGEAVALGMWIAIDDDSIKEVLLPIYKKLHQKTSINYDVEDVYNYVIHDKKAESNEIAFVTLKEIGQAEVKKIPLSDMYKRLEENVCQVASEKV